ncbi:SMI1/KNR4 family protein [Verrucomicrobiaceae bacterium N1E253]|uniref:SMI1/KNR4 family protein n=1 Tax=Oceaniferula marina TaxID=2748318 RepID=A0A851GA14_9BACT|nr:SMI1/KNR4 family protein [Oceaniferula marina]NWK54256.1 SMI1/KNR4 family protein [Oceaniferula marina]
MLIKHLQTLSSDLIFSEPVSDEKIDQLERDLDIHCPEALRSLLSETNGIIGEYGLGLMWDIERIKEDNLGFRRSDDFEDLYMPFDHLIFFGDAGNGDQFAFPTLRNGKSRDDIFVWNHEDDSRSWVAPSLEVFYEWWLTGRISV